MANIKICDRCGYKINPVESGSVVSVNSNEVRADRPLRLIEMDLCVSCAYKVKKFLKNEADIQEVEDDKT